MNGRRIGVTAVLAAVGAVVVLGVTPLGGATVRHISALIAPTSKSAVAQVNAYENWDPSTFSRDGFSKVTHYDTGIYCLLGRTNPDASMLKLTADAEHSNVVPQALMWDRSSPNCGAGWYEVYTYCPVSTVESNVKAPELGGELCDEVAFFAEAFKRA